LIVTDWKKKWIDVYHYYKLHFTMTSSWSFVRKMYARKYVFMKEVKIQFFFDKSTTTKVLLLRLCYDVVTITKYTTYILTWFPEKNHVNLWNNIELWIYAVYLIIENEKIEKNTRFTTYYYKYTTEKNPKLRAVEGNKTFGINFFVAWFYLFLFFEKLWSFLLNEWWWCVDNARNEEKKIKLVHMLKKEKEITKILQLFLLFWIKLTRLLGKRKNNLSNDLYFIIIINLFVAYVLMNFFKKKNPFEDNEILMFTKTTNFTTTPTYETRWKTNWILMMMYHMSCLVLFLLLYIIYKRRQVCIIIFTYF